MRTVRTYSQSSGLHPRLTYLLYTLCLRLIADFNEVVIQGGSRLSQVIVLLHCGAKPPGYGIVLSCFSLWCNPGAISLSHVAFHMESEKQDVSSAPLRLSGQSNLLIMHDRRLAGHIDTAC